MKRRDFLKKAGIAATGAALSPLMFANAQASTFRFGMVTRLSAPLNCVFGN